MEDFENVTLRLLAAEEFILAEHPPINSFKIHNIYEHPVIETDEGKIFAYHLRLEKEIQGAKNAKQTWWFSLFDNTFKSGYRHLKFFEQGGLLTPFTGTSLNNSTIPTFNNGKPVLIVEGHKQVSTLTDLGLNACTSGSASTYNSVNWDFFLPGTTFLIWPDNDPGGLNYAHQVSLKLKAFNYDCKFVDIDKLNLPQKGDCLDYLTSNPHITAQDILALPSILELNHEESSTIQSARDSAWDEPILFDRIEIPEINPHEVFHSELADYCQSVSEFTQTPPGLAVMVAQPVLACGMQNKYIIAPFDNDYHEPAMSWTVSVLPPGTRKTAVFNLMIEPINEWEKEQAILMRPEIEENYSQREMDKKLIQRLIAESSRPDQQSSRSGNMMEIQNVRLSTPDEIVVPRIYTSDTTGEQMQNLLALHDGVMNVFSDEGGMFENMSGLYGNAGKVNNDVYLKGHAGSAIRVDRKDRVVMLNHPAISFALTVQPEVIRQLNKGDKKSFRGKGILARIDFYYPKSNIGSRKIGSKFSIPNNLKSAYKNLIFQLLNQEMRKDDNGNLNPYILTLSDRAQKEFLEISEFIESQQGHGGNFEQIADWTGKLPGGILKKALVCHVAEFGNTKLIVNEATMNRACNWGSSLIQHTKYTLDFMEAEPRLEAAKIVWQWITQEGKPYFLKTECHKKLRARFKFVEQLNEALHILHSRNLISLPCTLPTDRKATIIYYVHPEFRSKET